MQQTRVYFKNSYCAKQRLWKTDQKHKKEKSVKEREREREREKWEKEKEKKRRLVKQSYKANDKSAVEFQFCTRTDY